MPDLEKQIHELEVAIRNLPQEALDSFIKFNQRHRYFVPLEGYHSIQHPLRDITCSATEVFLFSGNDKRPATPVQRSCISTAFFASTLTKAALEAC